LKQLPAGMFTSLRTTFPALAPTSWQHRVQRRILGVVRHRGVPADVEAFALIDNPEVRLVNADSYLVDRLYWFGERYGYEPEVLRWWRLYCSRSTSILELGANIGYFTVQGAKAAPQARYVAVEPHPGCAGVCRENVRLNGLTNVEVVEAAAVGKVVTPSVTLITPGSRSRDHYAQAPCTGYVGRNEMYPDDPDDPSCGFVTVPAAALSDLLDGVDLLKMDVEGQEFSILSPAFDQLAAARPTMFVELLDDTPKLRSFISALCAATDYRCFVPTPERLIPLPVSDLASVSLASEFDTRDLILTRDIVPEWSVA